MKPEDRALVLALVATVAVAAGGGLYFLVVAGSVPTALPIPAGTTFTANQTEQWAAHFDAGLFGGRLVGAWTAYHGIGYISLIVVNGTVSKPWPPPTILCPHFFVWAEFNGTINLAVGPGDHTVYWSAGYCSTAQSIVVTQPIEFVPS